MLTAGLCKFRFTKFMHMWKFDVVYASTLAHACLAILSSYLLCESREVMGFQISFFQVL